MKLRYARMASIYPAFLRPCSFIHALLDFKQLLDDTSSRNTVVAGRLIRLKPCRSAIRPSYVLEPSMKTT